jgi:hypothetical protein
MRKRLATMKLIYVVLFSLVLLAGCGRQETTPPGHGASVKKRNSLAEARQGFKTKIIRKESARVPVPEPPPDLFRIVRYDSTVGKLAALLSPDPKDGNRHPAIIWITSSDCNTIDDGIWKTLPADFDQTSRAANAFRRAGLILMFPTLRGGNDNPGFREGFFGEVDDVLAGAEFLEATVRRSAAHLPWRA